MTNTNWRQQAACQGADPNVFFPEAGDPLDHARRLCAMCPVLADCLADAVRLRDVHGFRAGRTGDKRRALWYRKARQHGKPLLGDVDTVPVLGVVRRRRALGCVGYSLHDLADHLGITHSTVASHTSRARVLRVTFDRWRQMYDALKDAPGPNERARKMAHQMGWAPPQAWDATTIDDPAAEPLTWLTPVVGPDDFDSHEARLRAARSAYVGGSTETWVIEGNREYDRLRKQRHRDRTRTRKGAA